VRRYFTRHLGLWLGLAGATLVALAGMTVDGLRDQAAERRSAQIAFLELAQDSQHLNRLVLESRARGRADDAVFVEVAAIGHAIDDRLGRDVVTRDGSQVGVRAVIDGFTSYRTLAERLLSGLANGNPHAGGAAGALGPAFDELEQRLRHVEAERSQQATAAEDRATRLSTATVGVLLALLLLIVGVYQRGRRRAEIAASESAALAASEARFRGLVDDNSDLILLIGADGAVRSASRAAWEVLGSDPRELEQLALAELVHPDDLPLLASAEGGSRHRRLEIRMRHRNGCWLDVEAVANDMSADTHIEALVLTIRDMTERKAFEEQLRHRAFHDPLTQLANRALLLDRLQHALSRETRVEDQVAVLFIDLDDFKLVNDRLGHASGDELLVMVARRLRSCLRSADTAARLGGDEFGVLLEGVPDVDQAAAVALRIIEGLGDPFEVGGLPIPLRTSVGVALGTAQTVSAEELLRNADIAMYAAKRAGKGRHVVFRADRHDDLVRRFPSQGVPDPERVTWFERSEEQRNEVLRLLRSENAVIPAFQPIVDLRTGVVAGYEALARFPLDADARPPNVWFAQAHRCGLGVQLEARAAVAALAAPRPDPPAGYLSVNLSPAALRADELRDLLPRDLGDVVIEITEHELVADGERLRATLDELRACGARIAVDDAGAGYAGLRQLMILRPDVIKLDRGLIEDVACDEAKQALVECFVRFAERTAADVCAEGIESLEDMLVLARLGVAFGQGYAIARPGFDWPEPRPEVRAALLGVPVAPPHPPAPIEVSPAGARKLAPSATLPSRGSALLQ
jgi:diguanylate cyclase (GGDEF)-like protein/PAS domain S-box-containing protein